MAGEQGQQPQVPVNQMDQVDQQDMSEAAAAAAAGQTASALTGGLASPMVLAAQADIAQVQQRAQDKAQLADAVAAGTRMRVDPEYVDSLAKFFEDEARGVRDRRQVVVNLTTIPPPGGDPTSRQVAEAFSRVALGDQQAYIDNCMKLADEFDKTAAKLRASAQQTRITEQNNEDIFQGGGSA